MDEQQRAKLQELQDKIDALELRNRYEIAELRREMAELRQGRDREARRTGRRVSPL